MANATPVEQGSSAKPEPSSRFTIRRKLLLACLAMSMIAAALGTQALLGVRTTGGLVVEVYDRALMSVGYARAGGAGFADMQAKLAGHQHGTDPERTAELAARLGVLAETLHEDVAIAAERALSDRARVAADQVLAAAIRWQALADAALAGAAPDWPALAHEAAATEAALDLLVNHTAGDGFRHRQRALETVDAVARAGAWGLAAALVLTGLVAAILARQIIGPVAAASAAAEAIAAGQLDTPIPTAGRDELGALLQAMARMREAIRSMVERERADRRSAQTRLADALEGAPDAVVLTDAEGRVVLANTQAMATYPGLALGDPPPAALALAPDGSEQAAGERWLRIGRSPTREGGAVAICTDITDLKRRERELRETNTMFDAALGNMAQGLCMFDVQGRLLVANRRFGEIWRLPETELRRGMPWRALLDLGDTTDALRTERAVAIGRRTPGPGFEELADGRIIALAREPLPDGGWVATYEDVTERRRVESQLTFLARHDALTGLPNRALLRERLEAALAAAHEPFAVLSIDLDRFKAVNDTLGHPVGDGLLRAVAGRLAGCIRAHDTAARLGGDEFAVIMRQPMDAGAAASLGSRIVDSLGAVFLVDGHSIDIGASVGIALAPTDGTTFEALLRNADTALYRAKQDGRGTWRGFEAGMDAALQARRTLERDLRRALVEEEFELFYQPLHGMDGERVTACEALLRWRHPTRGMVSPGEFIPVTEEMGLIIPLGEWVLRQACQQARQWPDAIKVAVNISAVQFGSPRLVQAVAEALEVTRLPARRLELEVTESVLLNDSTSTLATLHRLHELGVSIAMDDFGTGYSSLSYLRSFPFDKIKIDQSFIRDLGSSEEAAVIVRAIAGLGNALGMRITAEGVETMAQLRQLRAEGCDEVQGFLLGRPAPGAEVTAMLNRAVAEAA